MESIIAYHPKKIYAANFILLDYVYLYTCTFSINYKTFLIFFFMCMSLKYSFICVVEIFC